jgi:hypothetical protein
MASTCAYCGSSSPETVDHLPPKGVFPEPLPADPITVPCCKQCHAGTSNDDQHFRDVLLSAAELESEPRAAKARERLLRSIARPQQRRYWEGFVRAIEDVDVLSEGGIWLGQQPGIPLTPRIDRVVERIVRGLYWREFGKPLPVTHQVLKPHLDQGGRSLDWIAGLGIRVGRRPVVACGGQFSYVFAMTDEDPESGIWIGEFFGRVWAMAFLRRRER